MTISRRLRIFYLIVIELAQKYTRALVLGFVIGLLATIGVFRIYPLIKQQFFARVERVGLIGEFTPNNLPLDIQQLISSGLTVLAPDGAALPGLAESWSATDSGKTFTFIIKNDVTWHNGQPVAAQDINYNIKNVTFTPLDERTLQVSLVNPYSPFPTLVAKPLFERGLRGFGSYKLTNIRLNGDKVSFIRLAPVTPTDGMPVKEYRFYRTESAAVTGYKLGEVDVLLDLTSSYDLVNWRGTDVVPETKYNRIIAIFFNLHNPVFADKAFRQGLAYSVPELPGETAISPISKLSWAYTDKVKKYAYDTSAARKLLGVSKNASESATLTLSTFAPYESYAESIAKSWTDAGVPTSVKIVSSVDSDYQALLSFQELPPDPDQYPFWHSTQTTTNKTGFANVKIDKLLEDGRQELDQDKRKTIYADFQRRLVEEAPAVFLHYQTVYTIKRR